MAKDRRYYWLKLAVDFFETPEIRRLQKAVYQLIYLKILLLGLSRNDSGYIYFQEDDEDIDSEIAFDIRTGDFGATVEDVHKTIDKALKLGLIESENRAKYIYLPDLETMTGSETTGAIRQRRKRKKDREKSERDKVTPERDISVTPSCDTSVTPKKKCHADIDLDLDLEIDKDKEKDIETEKEIEDKIDESPTTSLSAGRPTQQEVINYFKVTKNPCDPIKFYSRYALNGWQTDNGDKIKDWRKLADRCGENEQKKIDEVKHDCMRLKQVRKDEENYG